MNWGYKIVIAFVFFVGFILYLVYGTFQQNIDLVAEDYYQQELDYQEIIDSKNNYAELSEKLTIKQTTEELLLTLPIKEDDLVHGEAYFFRPSDKTQDIKFELKGKALIVSKKHLISGSYYVKCKWMVDSTSYFHEQSLFVQK